MFNKEAEVESGPSWVAGMTNRRDSHAETLDT